MSGFVVKIKLYQVVVIFFVVNTIGRSHCGPIVSDCPASWVDYQHACYWPSVTITKNHSEAESDCIDKGGHLTSTVTAMEADVVRRIAKMPVVGLVWLGIKKVDGVWRNLDGLPLSFLNWLYGDPFVERGDCVSMESNGAWQDFNCSSDLAYVCKVIRNDVRCEKPREYINAVFSHETPLVNENVTIACERGWTTTENQTYFIASCQPGEKYFNPGHWESTFQGCLVDRDECEIANLCGGNHTSRCVNTVGSFYCLCEEGYSWTEGLELPNVDNLTAPHGYCSISSCAVPPALPNGVMEYTETGVGAVATFHCSPGYVPTLFVPPDGYRANKMVCSGDSWKYGVKPYPGCSRLSCGDPGLKSFSRKSATNFLFGDVVRYTCIDGFKPSDNESGDIITTCQQDGTWSPSAECIDIDECEYPYSACGGLYHNCTNYPGSFICTPYIRWADFGFALAIIVLCVLILLMPYATDWLPKAGKTSKEGMEKTSTDLHLRSNAYGSSKAKAE